MYRKILIFAGLFTVGWLGYFTLINVNQKDVTLLQQLDRPVGTQLFRAGDLVEVSADGTRLSFLCAMDVAEGDLREAPHAKRYVNGLAQSLGGFARVVNWVKSSVTGTDSAALEADDALAVEFRGKVTSIPSGTLPVPSQPCTCAIAEAMLRRSKVCMVSRSMNETRLVRQNPLDPKSMLTLRESAIGVSFRESAFEIWDFGQLNCPGLNAEAKVSRGQTCGGVEGYPIPVRLRNQLGVIRETEIMAASN